MLLFLDGIMHHHTVVTCSVVWFKQLRFKLRTMPHFHVVKLSLLIIRCCLYEHCFIFAVVPNFGQFLHATFSVQ